MFPPCFKPILFCLSLIKKNQDWTNKVQIVTISTDDDKEKAAEIVAVKGWNKMQHYWQDRNKDCLCSRWNVQSVPIFVFLDKKRRILKRCHPLRDLEKDISNLIEGRPLDD